MTKDGQDGFERMSSRCTVICDIAQVEASFSVARTWASYDLPQY